MEELVGVITVVVIASILLTHFTCGYKPAQKKLEPELSRTEYKHLMPSAYEAYLDAERENGTENFFIESGRKSQG